MSDPGKIFAPLGRKGLTSNVRKVLVANRLATPLPL
jgi:hypothetical protein